MKRVVLVIRDGWGISSSTESNAVAAAATPNTDRYLAECPWTTLEAAGESVGVPAGDQGSSEVGHLNMGAGRIVKQEVVRIDESITDGSLFIHPRFTSLTNNVQEKGTAFHVMGLVQDQGVHAQQRHLFAILERLKRAGVARVYVHFFGDGRDTPPRSALGFLEALEGVLAGFPGASIGTLMGRYYSMDRGKNWPLTDRAYAALVGARGRQVANAREAIERSYAEDYTPDGTPMTDEYIPPSIIGDYPGIRDGDSVMHFNYRQDRALQLTQAFVEDDYPGERGRKLDIAYCGLTRYYDEFEFGILPPLNESDQMRNLLGEVVSRAGLRQLRISETQKYRHVTSFFNGKRLEPYEGEDRIEIPGRFDPATFAEHPEMEAHAVADRAVEEIGSGEYAFVVLNFANGDMVGHTGSFEATVKAVEVVDGCVGRVVDAALAAGAVALVTADHGNAEEMSDPVTGKPKTAHSTNPVHLIYVGEDQSDVRLREHGILADVAPTVLYLLGLQQPADMTAENLIVT